MLGFFALESHSKLVYNETLSYQGIYYSAAAYCAYETLSNWTCGRPCNSSNTDGLTDLIQIINEDNHNFAYAGY